MIPDKSIPEIETVVKGIFEKNRKRSFLCAAFCATERGKTNRQTWGGKQTDAGNTSRKRQPPEYGRLSCPIDALSSFGALEYFKGKDGKRVRAPGGERDKAHARTGAVHAGRR